MWFLSRSNHRVVLLPNLDQPNIIEHEPQYNCSTSNVTLVQVGNNATYLSVKIQYNGATMRTELPDVYDNDKYEVHSINLVEHLNFGWLWWLFTLFCRILILSRNLRLKIWIRNSQIQDGGGGHHFMNKIHKTVLFFKRWLPLLLTDVNGSPKYMLKCHKNRWPLKVRRFQIQHFEMCNYLWLHSTIF